MKTEKVELRHGRPWLYECGGGWTNTGQAVIIAGPDGERLRADWLPRRGSANGKHAGFVVRPGLLYLEAWRDREGESVDVFRITGVEGDEARLEELGHAAFWHGGERVPLELEFARDAIEAAVSKVLCYHCREAHYVEREGEK